MAEGRFKNKTVIVTGASSGIGRAAALAFAAEGAIVAVLDVNAAAGRRASAQIESSGGLSFFVRCDVAAPDDVSNAINSVVERTGGLHCAFNNAGIGGTQTTTAECDLENCCMTEYQLRLQTAR